MSENYNVIAYFPIYNLSGAFQKPESECMVHKSYCFFNNDLLSNKNWRQN